MAQGALEDLEQVLPVAGEILAQDVGCAHLLLVDDDEHILQLCEHYLRLAAPLGPEGCETRIHCAASGEEALAMAESIAADGERVACALVDFVMPDGPDGVDTIRRLWERDPNMQCTLITGAGERVEDEIKARVSSRFLNRWDYLAKPFSEFEIVQRIRVALCSWFAHRREEHRSDENMKLVQQLARTNRELEAKVEERTSALAARLRELEAAQSKLLQQEKMACIGQMAAGVAHELNNPIGFVHSNLGTLRRYSERLRRLVDAYAARLASDDDELAALKKELKIEFLLEDLPALIEESLEGTERVRKIVSDLKVFSHPAESEPKYADLNEGLMSTLNIVHNEFKYKATVETEFGEVPPVRCLPGQINQVFMNLLVNAGQAIAESGEIRIATSLDGDHVVITIADTGCGIPDDAIKHVFDPFFTTKEVGQGTGLGLSISYDIVRKHGGSLAVESAPDKGTTFLIRLPIEGSEEISGQE